MRPVWKRILTILAILVFVYVIAMPIVMGGFAYGASGTRSDWQASSHYSHSASMAAMANGFGWMGQGAVFSGLLQLGVLGTVILGSVWLLSASWRKGRNVE